MSEHSPRRQRDNLQHDAEHERPSKRNSSVVLYLMILFAAAFLLLLMSFLMQNRSNREAMDHLEETSNSAMESLENRLRENEELKAQVAQLEEENDKLTQQVQQADDQARQEQEELTSVLQALSDLNTLRGLYNQGRYSDARDFLAGLDTEPDGSYVTETWLERYRTDYADPEDLEVYDPLAAWRDLVSWLG